MEDVFFEILNNWKVEAKSEDSERYFFHTKEVNSILNGSRCYVIGRKGTGKTAIAENILKTKNYNTFSEKLSFKNFPFNELYAHDDKNYRKPNQYITIWKYIIYNKICQMMAKNENISGEISLILRKHYEVDTSRRLAQEIKHWTTTSAEVNVLGTGISVAGVRDSKESSWIEKVDVLEDVIINYIDDSTYFICFDELDEDYRDILEAENHDYYIPLLTSLFKAVQDAKSVFRNNNCKIFPIVFLRNDIYEILMDPDKAKWNDFKIDIEWNVNKIKDLIAFRLARADNKEEKSYDFKKSWEKLFLNEKIKMGDRQTKSISIFDYMTRSTQLRPRDYIKYISLCVEERGNSKMIGLDSVRNADKRFSHFLKEELTDEIHGLIPAISLIFEVLSTIRKQTFHFDDFSEIYNYKIKNSGYKDHGAEFILKILFSFNVIGNRPKQANQLVFNYLNKNARFNIHEPILIHRGLYQALQIF